MSVNHHHYFYANDECLGRAQMMRVVTIVLTTAKLGEDVLTFDEFGQ